MADKKKTDRIPTGFADRADLVVSKAAEKLFQQKQEALSALGERPYKGIPTSPDEQLATWRETRRDVEGLKGILQENIRVKDDGRVLIRKGLFQTLRRLERRVQEGI